jgi:NitT/TauT family transport system ATP-binding protein/nitrate/nitrite transport system substrate-binding protein
MTKPIRLGLLRLCDSAPVITAEQDAIFAEYGVKVVLSVEPSWDNIADKIGFGLLEGGVMPPPLAMACMAGLRGRPTELVVPMSISSNGNAVTLAARHKQEFERDGLAAMAGQTLRLAVPHGFSTHDLLLRYWLAANGVEDVAITVLPPAEMVSGLAAEAIDGFCAGAPWSEVAVHAGLGFMAIRSSEIWQDHPEKCLALRGDFVARDPARVTGMLRALRVAGALCDLPAQRGLLAQLLAQPAFLDLPAWLLEPALDMRYGGPMFTAQYPVPDHARWFVRQLMRWGKLPAGSLELLEGLYRPDLFVTAGGAIPGRRVEVFCKEKEASTSFCEQKEAKKL